MSILDPSYMIDLGGIDVIQSQGVAIPGLYQKLLDNIGPCGNPLIYNWKFNGVFIPPQFVEPILEDDAIYINDIYVSSDDVVHIPSIEIQPNIVQLNVSENGEYEAPEGVDGYNPVVVDVETGVPLLTRAQWNALTTSQKRAYGLVAIQDYITGFLRGSLYNGADFSVPKEGDYTPAYSWNASNNVKNTYLFESTTPTSNDTAFCLAAMSQNGTNASWETGLPVISSGESGNGNYVIAYGVYANGVSASTYSAGNNWNNSEIVCFCLSGDAAPVIKEVFYEQGQDGTYQYTYQATENENLLLIAMRGGNTGAAYTVTGLTQKSHVTSSGARFNDVYFGAVESGDTVDISIPYAAGSISNGSLLVVLLSVLAEDI